MTADQAVSTVVGAILVLALITGAITLYQLTVVPGIKEDAEERHMDEASVGMAQLTGTLRTQIANRTPAPLTTSIALTAQTPAFVPSPASTGSLTFEDVTGDVTVASPNLKTVVENGSTQLGGSDDGWTDVGGTETTTDVDRVLALRVNLTTANPTDGDRFKVEITDADGNYAGDFKAITELNDDRVQLILQTREPPDPGTAIFHNHAVSLNETQWDGNYTIDLLDELYWFDLQLQDAAKPLEITYQEVGVEATFQVTFRKHVTDDFSTLVGSGDETEDFQRVFDSGTVSFQAQNEYYEDQDLDVEHGALLRTQTDGSSIVVDPPLRVRASGDHVNVGLDVPSLTGADETVSGLPVGTVQTTTKTRESFQATAGELEFDWSTESPSTWETFLEDELTDAGLTSENCPPADASSDCQFQINTTSDEVRLDLHGPHALDSDDQNPERDLFLELQRATIDTEVQR